MGRHLGTGTVHGQYATVLSDVLRLPPPGNLVVEPIATMPLFLFTPLPFGLLSSPAIPDGFLLALDLSTDEGFRVGDREM